MPIVETLTVTVGVAVMRSVAKAWIGDADIAAAAIDDVAELLRQAGLDWGERRRIVRELDEMTDRVSERLASYFENEQFGGLPANEQASAADAVAETINRGFANPSIAVSSDLNPALLKEQPIRSNPRAPQRALLSALATRLYDVALPESCDYIVAMVESLPRFATAVAAELLARERAILERLDVALERLPSSFADQAQSFETAYLRAIVRQLRHVGLMGFTTSEAARQYDLSVAYISLTAETTTVLDEPEPSLETEDESTAPASRGDADKNEDYDSSVEGVVAANDLLLIRGDAGSGKITLLQWLASNAARRGLPARLDSLNGTVPLYIPLRRYAAGDLPAPPTFIAAAGQAISGLLPDGWVESVLRAGRGTVLIDGVDEVPAERRGEVRHWLADLISVYPDAVYIVTSRPPAVGEAWLSDLDFASCLLEPMTLHAVEHFIEHWYSAVAVATDRTAAEQPIELAQALKVSVRDRPSLRRLATSPLLCAMLCALHYEGSADLPQDRIELYDRALEALLERRDAARHVTSQAQSLGFRRNLQLLQDLAYWLVRNGYAEAHRDQIVAQIGRSLERVAPDTDATVVYETLLQRTGLLREPLPDHIDFIHRTFLEYLAARAIVDEGDLGLLVERADLDTYQEIVVLAAGVGNRQQARYIVEGLLAQADITPSRRHKLQLLAVTCLETIVDKDPEIVARLEDVIRELVPPATFPAARELASAGDLAVPMLGPPEDGPLLAEEARRCVLALGEIGTDAALNQLARYAADTRVTVIRELVNQRSNFDSESYAQRVLADSPLIGGSLSLLESEVAMAPYLRHLRDLTVHGEARAHGELDAIGDPEGLEKLKLASVEGLSALEELEPKSGLVNLTITGCVNFASLVTTGGLPKLRTVTIVNCPGATDLAPLHDFAGLANLTFPWAK